MRLHSLESFPVHSTPLLHRAYALRGGIAVAFENLRFDSAVRQISDLTPRSVSADVGRVHTPSRKGRR